MAKRRLFASWTAAFLTHVLGLMIELSDVQTKSILLNSGAGRRPHKVNIVFENDLRKKVVILLSR